MCQPDLPMGVSFLPLLLVHQADESSETNQAGVFQGFQKILDTLSGEEKRALLQSLTAGGEEDEA
jgi:hypothetical protein